MYFNNEAQACGSTVLWAKVPRIVSSRVQEADEERKSFKAGCPKMLGASTEHAGSLGEVTWASLEVREGFQEEVASESWVVNQIVWIKGECGGDSQPSLTFSSFIPHLEDMKFKQANVG